jgi:hypothetical protein
MRVLDLDGREVHSDQRRHEGLALAFATQVLEHGPTGRAY